MASSAISRIFHQPFLRATILFLVLNISCRDKTQTNSKAQNNYLYIKEDKVIIKSQANENSATMAVVSINEKIPALDEINEETIDNKTIRWLQIQYHNQIGWVDEAMTSSHKNINKTLRGIHYLCQGYSNFPKEYQLSKEIILSKRGKYSISVEDANQNGIVYLNMGSYIEKNNIIEVGRAMKVDCFSTNSNAVNNDDKACIDKNVSAVIYRYRNKLFLHRGDLQRFKKEPRILSRFSTEMENGNPQKQESIVICNKVD